MSVKVFVYTAVLIIVIYSMDSLNINGIFKKNRIAQARIFYMLLAISLTYLVTNFIWDFFLSSKLY